MIRFELLDSISVPGDPDKPNDDAFGVLDNAAVLLDGATSLCEPLMPGRSDAAWLAQFGARRLLAHVKDADAPREAVRHAMEDAEKSFTALRRRPVTDVYEMPLASMMLIVASEDGFEALWFGDCAALVKRPGEPVTILGDTLAKRELEAARVARLAAKHGLSPAAGHNRPEYLSALRRARNYANTEKGGWVFGPDPRAADHVATRITAAPEDTLVLLATDGFLALISDYRRYDAKALVAAALSGGLTMLGAELREIESADAAGTRYPRFKTSDDATALLLRVG
jgi:nucleotide-binding universal stress UspA family protein